ncbi:MAG: hypothetical protein IMX00_01735 [Limnochordales bacterium]|nr:hypothetical protein [Limnochordales bacterium]
MPQNLQQVGIREFAFARAGDEQRPPRSEFWWVAPDGSRVLTAWMVKGWLILRTRKPVGSLCSIVDCRTMKFTVACTI